MPWNGSWAGAGTSVGPAPVLTATEFPDPDPEAATIATAPGAAFSRATPDLSITRGSAADFQLQCWNKDGRTTPVFALGDALSAAIYQRRVPTPVATPSVAWFTAGNTQTGYDQGQVEVRPSVADAGVLQPTGGTLQYTLVVTWKPGGNAAKAAPIVVLPLTVKANY